MYQIMVNSGRPEVSHGERKSIWQAALDALSEGDIDQVVNQFADQFTFTDHALGIEFKEKNRLQEYFVKIREFFPESERTNRAFFSVGDVIINEWTLAATVSEPFLYGRPLKVKIEAHGVSVVRVSNGRIVEWSEYYDQVRSRHYRVAGQFSNWCGL
jgi:ketosteroid isomerase-like protein